MDKRGFTLIEIVVAMGIFSLLISSLSSIFVQVLRSQKKTLAAQEILGQTSYVLEYMSRALRMAKKDIDGVCITAKLNYQKTYSGQGIKFLNYNNICQEFYLEAGRLKENKNSNILPLTSASLNVSAFNIGPDDSWDQNDDEQPKVPLFFEVEGRESSKIKIQTTVSQRNLDIER